MTRIPPVSPYCSSEPCYGNPGPSSLKVYYTFDTFNYVYVKSGCCSAN
ncbi:hypothetical protein J2Z69_001987 [Paenibacillus shirakamiensis]|uniref:Uncharacterized protein n=1 Tax=Paenibacillus shirakamiensis TaxID=1265935 RepID=A0ABS4JGU9_9BACL|nr:hypothetical protein [Paenibacillus shirakamiensis]MBP2000944.1 hypothetical protein [Paenibacillus shirakamiensis]